MKYLLPLLLAFCSLSSAAQNILSNGNFEQYTGCPATLQYDLSYSVGWRDYRNYIVGQMRSAYFNPCNSYNHGVPTNQEGYQAAASGIAYAGLSLYNCCHINNDRSYPATSFPALTPGLPYEISMSVSLGDNAAYGATGLGVYFYDAGPATASFPQVAPVTPQVSYSSYGPLINKTGWDRVSALFIPDSAYDNLVIGSFNSNSAATTHSFLPGTGLVVYSWYYIDSVVLRPLDTLLINYQNTMICGTDSFLVPYATGGGLFFAGNVFTIQLSNASGSFASPINIGSKAATTSGSVKVGLPSTLPPGAGYRMRIVASNSPYTSVDNGANISISTTIPAKPTITSNIPACTGGSLNLSATSTSTITSWQWTGPNGFLATGANPTISNLSLAMSGSYIVKAYHYGCASGDTEIVNVVQAPTTVLAGSNSALCDGDTIKLTAINSTATAYSWSGPNSFTASTQNTNITPALTNQSGDYVVTGTLNGCNTKDTVTVLVKLTPAVPIAASSSPICSGNSLNLTATSTTSGVSYNWTGPLSYTSTTQNPTITNATSSMSGTYSVTATLNGCTSAAATTVATVNLTPATPSAISSSPVCEGGALNLFGNSATPGVNYQWTGPNGFTSTTQNPTISPVAMSASGDYSVTAELNGCISTGTGTTHVTVSYVSSLGVYPSPNDTLCINSANANFVAVPFNAGTSPQYQWYKNNNLIGGATNITYPASGIADGDSFYCRMTVTGLCADPLVLYSNKVGMTVLPLTSGPSVTITADPGTLLSPWQLVKFTAVATNAGNLPKYQWKRNSQDVIGATSNVWSANNLSNGDTISCVVTSDVWCASPASELSNRMVVNIKTGITDIGADRKLALYPNPNNGSFVVHLPPAPSGGGYLSIDVVNAVGQTVYTNSQSQIPNSKIEITLPASVANGVYVLKLTPASGEVQTLRFTVSR